MRFIGSTKGRYGWEHHPYTLHTAILTFELNMLKSATLACKLMLAHVCSFILVVCSGLNVKHIKSHDTNFP